MFQTHRWCFKALYRPCSSWRHLEIRKEEPKIHCTCCDRLLTEFEATRRNANTFQFIDLCKVCFEDVKPFVPTIDRKDLITEQDLDTIDDDMDTDSSLEDVDALYSYHDTHENYGDDYAS